MVNYFDQLKAEEESVILQTYKRLPIAIERAEGVWLYDFDGNKYLDFVAGIAVNALGHAHPAWLETLNTQATKLTHVANIVYSEPAIKLASKLVELSGLDKVFFCNSGTESVEAAIKIARKWGKQQRGEKCFKIISFDRGFHGRTMGALSATATLKYKQPFEPLVPGFVTLPIHSHGQEYHKYLEQALDSDVCAIIVEPIQGEAGVWPLEPACLQGIRKICDERKILMICDEIQTGMGRTGEWFAYQSAGIVPDIVTLAKGLGAGFPIGATLVRGQAANCLEAGDHGSTFGGNPLACALAARVIEVIEQQNLLQAINTKAAMFQTALSQLVSKYNNLILEERGKGLMRALEFKQPIARQLVQSGLGKGVLLNATGEHTLRFVPALTISEVEIAEGLAKLEAAILC